MIFSAVLGASLLAALPGPGRSPHPWLLGDEQGSVSVGSVGGGYLVNGQRLSESLAFLQVLPTQEARDLRYGTSPLVRALERAAEAVHLRYPGAVLQVGNLSASGGGDIPWSVSHNSGRDADIGFYLLDSSGQQATPPDLLELDAKGWHMGADDAYRIDVKRTWAFVEALLSDPGIVVQYLFIATPLRAMLLKEAERRGAPELLRARAASVLIQPRGSLPHDDHIHVRIHCGPRDLANGCRESGPRREAAPDGTRLREDRARQALKALKEEDPLQRARAAQLLALVAWGGSEAALAAALRDPAAAVRRWAAQGLVELRARTQVSPLAAAFLQERDPEVLVSMAVALAELRGPVAEAALLALVDDTRTLDSGLAVRAFVLEQLADMGASALVPHAIDLLVDPEASVRRAALESLRRVTNIDLGIKPGLWWGWWRHWADRGRRAWLAEGFRVAGYGGPSSKRMALGALLDAVADPQHHISENARRQLMGRLGRKDRKNLMWSTQDASWYWRVALRRSGRL